VGQFVLAIATTTIPRREMVLIDLLVWFLVLAAIVLLLRALLRHLLRALFRNMVARRPRAQRVKFARELRDLVFRDPFAFMSRLCADDRRAFVQSLWKEVGWKVARGGQRSADHEAEIDVKRLSFSDGRAIAVVCLPPPERDREAYFVGVVLPQDESLKRDLPRARRVVRYFVLNRGSMETGRSTDLCAWTPEGRELTYNIGAPKSPEGFARAVEEKLHELGQ